MNDYRVPWKIAGDLKNTYGSDAMTLEEAYDYRDEIKPVVFGAWIEKARWELFVEEDE